MPSERRRDETIRSRNKVKVIAPEQRQPSFFKGDGARQIRKSVPVLFFNFSTRYEAKDPGLGDATGSRSLAVRALPRCDSARGNPA